MAIFQSSILQMTFVLFLFLCIGTTYICAARNRKPIIRLGIPPSQQKGVMDAREDTPVKSYLAIAEIEDKDPGEAGRVTCEMDNKYTNIEPVHSTVYKIELKALLDREKDPLVEVLLKCYDHGTPSYTSTATFTILVSDANDNPPVFTNSVMKAQVQENAAVNTLVARIVATDADEGINAEIRYSLDAIEGENWPFSIDPTTGEIFTSSMLDRESKAEYNLTVVAIDSGVPSLTGIATVNIMVEDLNDNTPVIIDGEFHAVENQKAMVKIGTLQGKDADTGKNARLEFSKVEDSDSSSTAPFLVLPSGDILSVVTLDREQRDYYELVARVADQGTPSLSSTSTVVIHVDDVNDNTPVITSPCLDEDDLEFVMDSGNNVTSLLNSSGFIAIDWYSPDDARVVYRAKSEDDDVGENARLSYSIHSVIIPSDGPNSSSIPTDQEGVNPLFQIGETTGEVKLRRVVKSEQELVQLLKITVVDHGEPALSAHCLIHVIIDVKMIEVTTPSSTDKNTNNEGDTGNAAPSCYTQLCHTDLCCLLLFSVILSAFTRWCRS